MRERGRKRDESHGHLHASCVCTLIFSFSMLVFVSGDGEIDDPSKKGLCIHDVELYSGPLLVSASSSGQHHAYWIIFESSNYVQRHINRAFEEISEAPST